MVWLPARWNKCPSLVPTDIFDILIPYLPLKLTGNNFRSMVSLAMVGLI